MTRKKKMTELDRCLQWMEADPPVVFKEQWARFKRLLRAAKRDKERVAKLELALQDAIDSVRNCADATSIRGSGVRYLLNNALDWDAAIAASKKAEGRGKRPPPREGGCERGV